ncbi:FAD-dependent monooxygenase [Phreatobacter stygius]|uniref:Monooxygenase n=1 Tax=Phreatobacter stygius TaxID=1940610 RepID=A0A4D7BIS0_9HYPH|nr:FAD-dependent monooxygenase [Phreatobacter stygius]QCI67722.1 monooxygenase [Phreatobacter stygius]
MRPKGRGPLESLYFDYPVFAAEPAPELSGQSRPHPVVIVGAGPIGMTAALTLARYGVKSVMLEAKNTFNDGSRAICIARQSFQILDQVGAVAPFLEKSLGWTRGRSFYRGREIYAFEMPHGGHEKYLPMYNLEQQYIEQFLHQAVARSDLIDMRWQSAVTGIAAGDDSVTLDVGSPHGAYRLAADYVLAADGARSTVRSKLGLRLSGQNYEGRYVIADIQMDHDYPTERRAFFEPASNPGGTVLVHRQPDNIWRIDYQLKDGESEDEAMREETIRARVGAILADIGHRGDWALEWWSVYTANTLCLDDYRRGRVMFIGDSAHIVPIFGVRGLNNGFADAQNIGWKLAYVLDGAAGEALLDSYSPERRGATLDVFANATKSTRFMTPPTRGWKLMREAVLSLALGHDFARAFADPRQMLPYSYAESPLTLWPDRDRDFAGGPPCGAASANARLADGGFLLDHAGDGFTALVFAEGPLSAGMASLLASLGRLDRRFKALTIGGGGQAGAIADPDGNVAGRYDARPGTVYLLRPDLHVAGRWRDAVSDEIIASLSACLGRSAP